MNRFLVPFLIALTGHFVTTPQPILLCAVTSIAIILNGLVPLKQILLVWKLLIFLFLKIYPRLLTFLLVFLIMMLILLSSSELLVSTFARNCFLPVLDHTSSWVSFSLFNTTLEDVWITPLSWRLSLNLIPLLLLALISFQLLF